ncbi:MAG: DNA polymerase III subunit beta [Candidatus Buchananbacteria bacterium CG10_big_fil_rev_8_21_14_0_10_42_9]|uniref:Beta sliding clamp n=1 Tax=Candidatus Buchananbacteria bacterium CG10_big_fil_rev_8_21_14_0_10_42_9 TaxID=1974526 RepID=A0A2H0W0K4_9BACT|nr:MAG: DNA polymerase III subunit beta [Candidatus Buchananbacteria bacterium CG10_big_fil_rev_8_21_14_0_10_42_9]
MKLICTQENLLYGLSIAGHIAAKSANLPILNNVLIKSTDNGIILMATNLEIAVSCQVRGKVESKGETTTQSRLLTDYISFLPKENITLEVVGGDTLSVQCKKNKTKIKGLSATDFPVIPDVVKENPIIVGIDDLRQALSEVAFAITVNETRPEISGVFMQFSKENITLAATDSYRLAERVLEVKKGGSNKSVIVPVRTILELLRILGSVKSDIAIEEVEEVKIYLNDNQILFNVGEIDITSRLIEGQYPDYKQIIPDKGKTKTTVSRVDLIKAVKAASLFTRSGIFDISLDFSAKDNKITITSSNNQLGENTTDINTEVSGEGNSTVLNYRYLLDVLQVIDTSEVVVEVIDGSSPVIVRPSSDEQYIYIIMPIKQ